MNVIPRTETQANKQKQLMVNVCTVLVSGCSERVHVLGTCCEGDVQLLGFAS